MSTESDRAARAERAAAVLAVFAELCHEPGADIRTFALNELLPALAASLREDSGRGEDDDPVRCSCDWLHPTVEDGERERLHDARRLLEKANALYSGRGQHPSIGAHGLMANHVDCGPWINGVREWLHDEAMARLARSPSAQPAAEPPAAEDEDVRRLRESLQTALWAWARLRTLVERQKAMIEDLDRQHIERDGGS